MAELQLCAFTVTPNLLAGGNQAITFNKLTSQFQIVNSSIPTNFANSNNLVEMLNSNYSGYRFHQQTSNSALRGDFILEQFNTGKIPGTSLLRIQESTGNIILSPQGVALQLNNGISITPLQFFEETGTYYVGFQAPSGLTENTTYNWPLEDAVGIQALFSDGSRNLSFRSIDTMPWVSTSTSITMVPNTQYIAQSVSSPVNLLLPTVIPQWSEFQVVGDGAGGWQISQNSGQQIIYGIASTTSGSSGYLQSTGSYDCIRLVCTAANSKLIAYNSGGNITFN